MAIDMFEPRTLLAAVQNSKRAPSVLRDHFFGNVRTFDTKTVDVDIAYSDERTLADFTSVEMGATFNERPGYVTRTYRPAYIAPARICTAEDALKRAPGENLYADMGPEARAAAIVARDLTDLDKQISRREEWMASKALFEGKIAFGGKGADAEISYWPEEEAKKPFTEVATKWGETGADPLGDIAAIADTVADRCEYFPSEVWVGSKAIIPLMKAIKADKGFDALNIVMGNINPQTNTQNFYSTFGYINVNGVQMKVIVYKGSYFDGTKTVHYVPDDEILVAAPEAETIRAYGVIPVADVAANTTSYVTGDRVPSSWVEAKTGSRVIKLASAPVLIPTEVQAFHVGKVL